MLNITAQKSAEGAKQYFARSDYYVKDSQELVGRWGGKGAVLLGLFGEVNKQSFDRMCDNRNPITGESLTKITRDERRVGYDFTWSAPKSVSVVHAMMGDERIMQAFRDSIHDTMTEMESEMQARVRKDGKDEDRTTGNLTWAEFVHLTSRPVDGMVCPQLHSHIYTFNSTYDVVESQWKAGQFGKLKSEGYYWQAVQQARFANRLQELGYSIRKTKDAFEINGVPETVLKKFSLRTTLIERVAEKLGVTDPKTKAKLAATTREAKLDSIPYSELVEHWDKMITPDERQTLLEIESKPTKPVYHNDVHATFAAEHIFERASVVDERRLLTLALRHGIGAVTPEGVRGQVNKMSLLKREDGGKVYVTTKEILSEERRLIGIASQSKGTCRPLIGNEAVAFTDRELDAEQRAAVELSLRSADKIMIIRGIAGTGKSRSVSEVVRQLHKLDKEVVLVAPTVRAVGVLKEDGFDEAGTLAKLLVDPAMQNRAKDGYIILDEAGLVGSKPMTALFKVAQDVNARIVLLGDKRQLAAVDRGSPLRILEDLAGLKVVEISNIRRQSGDYREAVKLLSRGKTGEGLEKLDAMGCVKLTPVWDSYEPIARDYVKHIGFAVAAKRNPDKEALIVCPTHAEGQKVTDAVRTELRKRGLLGSEDRDFMQLVPLQWTQAERADKNRYSGEEILQFHRNTGKFKAGQRVTASAVLEQLVGINAANFSVYNVATIALAKGDLIRMTAKGRSADGQHALGNGSIYRVKGFDHGDIVLDNDWLIPKDCGQLAHAYANTAYAAQGRTVNHVLIAQSAMSFAASSRESFYVAASRGKKSVVIYTDDKPQLKNAVERSNPRLSAIELQKKQKPNLLRRMRERIMKTQLAALVAAKARMPRHPNHELEIAYAR